MRTTFIILLFLTIALNSISQTVNHCVPKSVDLPGFDMKRTCLQKDTNADEQNSCEFHPVEILIKEGIFDPKEIQQVKSFVQMKKQPLLDSVHIYTMTSRRDSTLTTKTSYCYNTMNKLTLQKSDIRYYLSGTHDLIDWYTYAYNEYTYDENGNLILRRDKIPDEDYVIATATSYNDENEKIKEQFIYCYASGNCDTVGFYSYTYDKINRREIRSGMMGTYHSRDEIIFDESGNSIQTLRYVFTDEGDSILEDRKEYTYNEYQQLLTVKEYAILGNPSLFLTYEEFYYYEENRLDSIAKFSYNYNGSLWNDVREFYSYEPNGGISTRSIVYLKDNKWMNSTIDSFAYNSNDQLIMEETYAWYSDQWEGQVKKDYRYDSNGNLIRMLEYNSNFDWATGWKLNQTYYYYYQTKTGNPTISVNKTDHQFYPNPSKGVFFVHSSAKEECSLTIYAIDGKQLFRQPLTAGTNQIRCDHLSPGIYLVRVSEANSEQIGRIVINQ